MQPHFMRNENKPHLIILHRNRFCQYLRSFELIHLYCFTFYALTLTITHDVQRLHALKVYANFCLLQSFDFQMLDGFFVRLFGNSLPSYGKCHFKEIKK